MPWSHESPLRNARLNPLRKGLSSGQGDADSLTDISERADKKFAKGDAHAAKRRRRIHAKCTLQGSSQRAYTRLLVVPDYAHLIIVSVVNDHQPFRRLLVKLVCIV